MNSAHFLYVRTFTIFGGLDRQEPADWTWPVHAHVRKSGGGGSNRRPRPRPFVGRRFLSHRLSVPPLNGPSGPQLAQLFR
ncbi:unnamed protein product [Spirodela intermedia]|uniref:Uncharacterized protein n=1 Tax=Spirodela intermedia TaxID=51605 RepID=A0A7I8JJG3_SPIIN|nr:unnamed protein product [Spirodela intermedia]CAA6670210.1 unnamed protein product [Spirodela intermedia]